MYLLDQLDAPIPYSLLHNLVLLFSYLISKFI